MLPNTLDRLTSSALCGYLDHFLAIDTFKKIKEGRELIELILADTAHAKVAEIMRKVYGLFRCNIIPAGRVCSMQFLKGLMESQSKELLTHIEGMFLGEFRKVVEYRKHVRSVDRGSNYLIRTIERGEKG